jgi:hypothetical protein
MTEKELEILSELQKMNEWLKKIEDNQRTYTPI